MPKGIKYSEIIWNRKPINPCGTNPQKLWDQSGCQAPEVFTPLFYRRIPTGGRSS
jgi:hypothetical protein